MSSETRHIPSLDEMNNMIDSIRVTPQKNHSELPTIHYIAEHPEEIAEIDFALLSIPQMQELHDEIVQKNADDRFIALVLEALNQSEKSTPIYAQVNRQWAALAAAITAELPAPGRPIITE